MLIPALSAKSVGVVSMHPYSQIANRLASTEFRTMHNARKSYASHTAKMETEKNGGENFLQKWREFRRMTREELAEKVGTTAAVIWHLEQGERGLSAKWLRKLAPPLNTSPGFLLDYDPNLVSTDLIEIWSAIPPDQREQAMKIIETFARRDGTSG
jgi:transcriptional regulator with XRE-family HTH domain